jgi:hypothetical protein
MIRSGTFLALLGWLFFGGFGRLEARKPKAQRLPQPQKENQQPLPSPRIVPQADGPALKSPPLLYSYPRVSRYEVWQNLAVDRSGRFRPVVIDSPYGAYYRYNHQPFPWTTLYPWEFAPYIMGPSQPALRK